MKKTLSILLVLFALLLSTSQAQAQSYSFQVTDLVVHAFWNEDGTLSIDYLLTFKNDSAGHVIDFVDVAMPNNNFDANTIFADVSGNKISDISRSDYQGTGSGVAVAMGKYTIPAGKTGSLHVYVGKVSRVLYPDTEDKNYASAVFAPLQFPTAHGPTKMSVTFHLPKGVKPEEPRWHAAPSGFPSEPATNLDEEGRVTYTWQSQSAQMSAVNNFGASFPKQYIPDSAIVRPNPFAGLGAFILEYSGCWIPLLCFGGVFVLIIWGLQSSKKRQMQYLPPKISIEGHGIKRGLTAIEAALLMEQPMDKVMTMILFSVIKKSAAQVTSRDPLEVKAISPAPEGLLPYETSFIQAFAQEKGASRAKALQAMIVEAIKQMGEKMKGFSRKETIAYYKDIMQKAWTQVEAANTPEVKSQKFDEVMEWTMLDGEFNDRTRRVFTGVPVFVPMWWGGYDPGYHRPATTTLARPSIGQVPSGGGQISMPHLPGSDFAASIVGGVTGFSQKVVGNISDFTSKITNQTNPMPKPTSSSGGYRGGGGGGRSCACACACAGCACACAGGGR